MNDLFSKNEVARIKDLKSYRILDTEKDERFQEIARTAADECFCPIALIGFIEENRHWIKASHGLEIAEIPREISLCAHTIRLGSPLLCWDTMKDDRFKSNPFVVPENGLRFYTGVPIISSNGHAIGVICVADYMPGVLTQGQVRVLENLAREVLSLLEIKRCFLTPKGA